MRRVLARIAVSTLTACLGACTTIQATPHLPSLIWQTPPTPATTAPPETPGDFVFRTRPTDNR